MANTTDDGSSREVVRRMVAAVDPVDHIEADHQQEALAWIDSGAPLWRLAAPNTPPMHLVSYAVLVDPDAQMILLGDHLLAGLWLPTGGHVDVAEHPAVAARRELGEELGIDAPPYPGSGSQPLFVSVTSVANSGDLTDATRHTDVSLWFVFSAERSTALVPDPGEFASVVWWPFQAVRHGDGTRFGRELPRFVAKLC